jgi:hypothetical protein
MFRIIYFQFLEKNKNQNQNILKYEQNFFTKVIKNSYNLYPRIDMCLLTYEKYIILHMQRQHAPTLKKN